MHRRQPFPIPVCARPDHEMVRAGNPGYVNNKQLTGFEHLTV